MKKKVLVSGGNGFLTTHIIDQLLERDYQVKASVRNEKSATKLGTTLKENNTPRLNQLELFYADLLKDDGWADAFTDVDYFLSVASPVFFGNADETEQINVSKSGTLRLMGFAQAANVKKIVMTSNYGAIGFSSFDPNHLINEADWTNTNQPGLSAYEKSKTLAEQAAWDFAKPNDLNLTTINPLAMFSPSLNNHISGNFDVLKTIVGTDIPILPKINLNMVDVRDVATMHILAMENDQSTGERLIASAPGQISFQEMAQIIQETRPDLSKNLPKRTLPTWALQIASHLNHAAREGLLLTKLNRHIDTTKSERQLNFKSEHTNRDIVIASLDSLAANI